MKNKLLFVVILAAVLVCFPWQVTQVARAQASPSITIISPNGGEKFVEGQTIIVKWKVNNFPKDAKINIIVMRTDGLSGDIGVNIPASQGRFVWKVKTEGTDWGYGYLNKPKAPNKIVLASFATPKNKKISYQYNMYIRTYLNGGSTYVEDGSDGTFTVIKKSNPDLTLADGFTKDTAGFKVRICNIGNKDLKKPNKQIEGMVSVFGQYSDREGGEIITKTLPLMPAVLKKGTCVDSISINYADFKMTENKEYEVVVVLDPNNKIEELTEPCGRLYRINPLQ